MNHKSKDDGWTIADVAAHYKRMGLPCPMAEPGGERHNKYGVAPKEERTIDGVVFASKREAYWYTQLRLWERIGKITGLQLQPRFELVAARRLAGGKLQRAMVYVADFEYFDGQEQRHVVDVKGHETPVFRLKAKLFRERYPELILEIWK
jgi:hypothetical protein